MEALANSLPILLNLAIAGLVVALGLNARPSDLTFLWRQPGLLLRSLIAVVVVVPIAAFVLVRALELPRHAVIGILAMAACPGAPFAPQKQLKLGGRLPYVYSLLVVVTLFALLTIPATLTILHSAFAEATESLIMPRDVARITVLMLLVPLGIGVAIRRFLPSLAERLAKPLATIVNVFILLVVLLILVKAFPKVLDLGPKVLGAMAVLTLIALAGGHLLGGPVPEDRTALAFTSALRHPGLALTIGKVDHPGEPIAAVVLAYLLVTSLAAIPYTAWRKRAVKPHEGRRAHAETT
jgi:BASS family bile acid:Na+ symporter